MLKTVLAALSALSLFRGPELTREERAQGSAITYSLAEFARTKDEVAFLVAWGDAETEFSLRIHRGLCERWECDRGRARGPWQAHRNGMPEERWARMVGVENTRVQVETAARHARWALRQCPDRIRGAFRVLGGLGCDVALDGEDDRVRSFQRVRRSL